MLNDRDDKYEPHDDTEYHFSDDEVSYDTEGETAPKPTVATAPTEGVMSRLSRSKRMLISLVVFFVLVFVVYKMVAPGTSVPSTEITPTAAATTPAKMASAAPTPKIEAQPATVAVEASAKSPVIPVEQASISMSQAAQMPASQPASPAMQPSTLQTPAMQMTPTPTPPAVTNPLVVQAQSPMTAPSATPVTPTQSVQAPVATADGHMTMLVAETERLVGQLQAQYAQRLNDYANQNKMLQDQIQVLNSRVAVVENQMNQLIQAITQQLSGTASTQQTASPVPPAQAAEPKMIYTVQAIIPGRAWLRSENGETVTVAEGDVIRELGRVTKIDPYNGIVEINTGSKVVSLSYGNG